MSKVLLSKRSARAEKFLSDLRSRPEVESLTLSWDGINSLGNLVECYQVSGERDQTQIVIHNYCNFGKDDGFRVFNFDSSGRISEGIEKILLDIEKPRS